MLLSLSSYFLRRKKLRSYIISRVFSAATGDYFTFYNSSTFFFLSIFKQQFHLFLLLAGWSFGLTNLNIYPFIWNVNLFSLADRCKLKITFTKVVPSRFSSFVQKHVKVRWCLNGEPIKQRTKHVYTKLTKKDGSDDEKYFKIDVHQECNCTKQIPKTQNMTKNYIREINKNDFNRSANSSNIIEGESYNSISCFI